MVTRTLSNMCARDPKHCALRDGHEGQCLNTAQLEHIIAQETKTLDKELKDGLEEAS
jgi:hypothetical protein